jgi:hypothetical protein
MLPQLKDCEGKYSPTQVHLQVYDGACHVLPMLSFTEPAKHCYRAIASWCKFVTSHHPVSHDNTSQPSMSSTQYSSRYNTVGTNTFSASMSSATASQTGLAPPILTPITIPDARENMHSSQNSNSPSGSSSVPTFLPTSGSNQTASPAISIRHEGSHEGQPQSPAITDWELTDIEASQPTTPVRETPPERDDETGLADLQGEIKVPKNIPKGYAGNYDVYLDSNVSSTSVTVPRLKFAERVWDVQGGTFKNNMIRERVSVHGECRPLEDTSKLSAFSIPLQEIGVVKEAQASLAGTKTCSIVKLIGLRLQAERYLRGQVRCAQWDSNAIDRGLN